MNWLKKIPPKIQRRRELPRHSIPEGLWCKCSECSIVLYTAEWERNNKVCSSCGYHHQFSARERIASLLGSSEVLELGKDVLSTDPLNFYDQKSYQERLQQSKRQSGEDEALIVVTGMLAMHRVVLIVFEFSFMGGSMGSVVGERFVRGVRYAIEHGLPVICVTSSGGARMQEGGFSLMQMVKTTASIRKLADVPLPFITVMTNPTMGGVSASFVFNSDIVIAEPGALLGFAGPRIIQKTVHQPLPEGFQRSELLLEQGAIDMVVSRDMLRDKLVSLLYLLFPPPCRKLG